MKNVDFADFAFDRKLMKSTKVKPAAKKPGGKVSASAVKIRVVKGDVAATVADAVVNAANEHLRAGSGICGAIFRRAGLAQLQAACDKVAPCPTGEARVTPAFGITNAKYIIHAVGPRYVDGRHGEPEKLASCYRNLLSAAVENGCKSVAVPSISTGVFGYPLKEAVAIAVRETKAFLAAHPDLKVVFVAWDDATKALYDNEVVAG